MNTDSVDVALRHVAETRSLLETLITSSESFDYHGAKAALKQLKRKVRDLGKFQAELEEQRRITPPNVQTIDFRSPTLPQSPRVSS